jgi:serine/threonine-protein kinase PpkA
VRFPELELEYEPGVRLPIGEQLIEVSRPGYLSQQIRYYVRYGDNRTRVELQRSRGSIRVTTTPEMASVLLSYDNDAGARERVTYKPGMTLPIGTVEVSGRAIGYRTAFKTIELSEQGARVALKLSPMRVKAGEVFADELANGGLGPRMIVIPAGRFLMGDPDGPPSMQPATVRTLSQPFAVSVLEISVAEYRRFAQATGTKMDDRLVEDNEPVRYVDWSEAMAYANWLTLETGSKYRLLTEAEWEYVARAGTDSDYWFGDEVGRLCEFANLADLSTKRLYRGWAVLDCDDGFGELAPVGSFPANPFGVHDVHGNVSEWVLECGMPEYRYALEDGAVVMKGQSCSTHGVRGGSWDSQPEALQSRRRGYSRHRGDDRGIRLLKEL